MAITTAITADLAGKQLQIITDIFPEIGQCSVIFFR
jgi:hypothetical protein